MSTIAPLLIDVLLENARRIGPKASLVLLPETPLSELAGEVTWCQLAQWVDALKRELQHQGTQRPLVHRVTNDAGDLLISLACQAAGRVEVPVDADGGDEYLWRCRDAVAGEWVDKPTKHRWVRRAWDACQTTPNGALPERSTRVAPNQDAVVLWTSGTSGDPKGVVLSHRSLAANARAKLQAVPQTAADRRLTVLSIAHGYARTCDIGTWILSGCVLAVTHGFSGWVESCDRFSPTLCNMVPSLAERVIDGDRIPSSLRLLGCGGAAMSGEQFRRWRGRGVTVIQGYGLTEAGPVICSQTPNDSVAGHVGRVVGGWEHRIDRGRLFVRGDHQMTRYWDDADSTARRIDPEGWLDTGDMVEQHPISGQFRILGRADDRIVLSNGHKVDPHGVEQRIASLDGIRTAVIVCSSDGRSTELWVELDDGAGIPDELSGVITGLPRWERPTEIRSFEIPAARRSELFNRKGAIRRAAMLRFLSCVPGS